MAKPTPLEPPVTMAQRCRSELRSTSPKREGAFHRSKHCEYEKFSRFFLFFFERAYR